MSLLEEFFSRPVCQKATAPLKQGVEIAVQVMGEDAMTLRRETDGLKVLTRAAQSPDMSFSVPPAAMQELAALKTEDIGEIGVAILKLMAHEDTKMRITPKVHIGALDFYWHGYLGILPLGGATVMKFLASKGLTGISKIKQAISRLKE